MLPQDLGEKTLYQGTRVWRGDIYDSSLGIFRGFQDSLMLPGSKNNPELPKVKVDPLHDAGEGPAPVYCR